MLMKTVIDNITVTPEKKDYIAYISIRRRGQNFRDKDTKSFFFCHQKFDTDTEALKN